LPGASLHAETLIEAGQLFSTEIASLGNGCLQRLVFGPSTILLPLIADT
jgi:hypothetical protein